MINIGAGKISLKPILRILSISWPSNGIASYLTGVPIRQAAGLNTGNGIVVVSEGLSDPGFSVVSASGFSGLFSFFDAGGSGGRGGSLGAGVGSVSGTADGVDSNTGCSSEGLWLGTLQQQVRCSLSRAFQSTNEARDGRMARQTHGAFVRNTQPRHPRSTSTGTRSIRAPACHIRGHRTPLLPRFPNPWCRRHTVGLRKLAGR